MRFVSVVSALAVLVIACSSTTTTTISPPADAGKGATDTEDSTDAGKSKSDAAASTDDDGTDTSPDAKCADETDQQGCLECCAGNHSSGAAVYQGALQTCVCGEDNCKTECGATYCASTPKNPDAACTTCLNAKKDSCGEDLTKACNADTGCTEFYTCLTDSSCPTKK